MTALTLGLLFFAAGAVAIAYYNAVPSEAALRRRLPNTITLPGVIFGVILIAAIWFIATYTSGFLKVAAITTLVFALLLFESLFLLMIRWIRSTVLALLICLIISSIPFIIQYLYPTFALSNVVIILATLGATTLLIRLKLLRTRIVILMAFLFAVNDVLNVLYLVPKLNLVPVSEPLRLLIFPTVTAGGRVVGSGDFMFLVLTTLVVYKDLGTKPALLSIVLQSLALVTTILLTPGRDVLVPFLVIMTPVFLGVYFIARLKTETPQAA